MNDFFDKLNTLIRVKFNDLLGSSSQGDTADLPASARPIDRVAHDAEKLRERVNDAVGYEKKLQTQIDDIYKQLPILNRQADEATEKGNEAMARHFIEKINRLQDRLTTLEKDLAEHQQLAQDLMHKVNQLEATIADIQTQKASGESGTDDDVYQKNATDKLSDLVNDTQRRIQALGDKIMARKATLQTQSDDLPSPISSDAPTDADIDDDLERRRNRLSKK
jgi:phage shock protein A